MKQRILTAIVALLALGALLFLMPGLVAKLVLAALVVSGAWEWSGFLGPRSMGLRLLFVVLITLLIAAVSLLVPQWTEAILIASLVWWFAALLWIFAFPTPIPQVVRWLGGIMVLLPLYLALMILFQSGPLILLFALLVVWVADSGAYFAGKALGRVKLAPRISPQKTWEGVIGGLFAVALLTLASTLVVESKLIILLPFCLAAAALSIVGDLTVSMFKRTAGLKDSGRLFPGHGGVLDRIDSVAAAAPLFALGLRWIPLA